MMVFSIRVHVLLLAVTIQAVECTSLSPQEVILCNGTVLRAEPNHALTYAGAKDACITENEDLASISDLDHIGRCPNGNFEKKKYWLSDIVGSQCTYVDFTTDPLTNKTTECKDYLYLLCKKTQRPYVPLNVSPQEVITCNSTFLQVDPNHAFTYTGAKDACITKDETLPSISDLGDIIRCTNGSLVHTKYWLSDTIGSQCTYVDFTTDPPTSKTTQCQDYLYLICKKTPRPYVPPHVLPQEVITCNSTFLRVDVHHAFTYTGANDACVTNDETLASIFDLDDIVRCTNGSLAHTKYWLSDTIGSQCTYVDFTIDPPTNKTTQCQENLYLLCKKTPITYVPHYASRISPVDTMQLDNTFIHVVRESLTQQHAEMGCDRLFQGSLFTMATPKELFSTIKQLNIADGNFWLRDVKESNEIDDCLILAKQNGKNSLRVVNCDEDHFSICQSVADPSLLLNSAFFEEVLTELVLHKNDTSKEFRAKNSIWDSRESAHIVGGSGIVFMAIFAVVVALFDLPYLKFCFGCVLDRITGLTHDGF